MPSRAVFTDQQMVCPVASHGNPRQQCFVDRLKNLLKAQRFIPLLSSAIFLLAKVLSAAGSFGSVEGLRSKERETQLSTMAAILLRSLLNKKVKQIHSHVLQNSWFCFKRMQFKIANNLHC